MITGLDTLFCQVDDMDRAVAFYSGVLGLTPTYASPHWTGFELGGVRFGLHPRFNGSGGDTNGNFVAGLAVEDLEAFRDHLKASGAWCAEEFHIVPGGKLLDFRDPDGNWLQAVERS